MLIQKNDILCKLVLREPEERVRFIIDHITQFYDEFKRYKTDIFGNKRRTNLNISPDMANTGRGQSILPNLN